MSYVILQLAVSLDGYISRKDHTVDFLEEMNPALSESFHKFLSSIDTIIMGSKTYEVMLGFGDIPFQDKTIYVLTNKQYESKYDFVHFSSKKIKTLLNEIEGTIWLFGGSSVIQSFINEDLIDEFIIHYVPHIIGDGIPLFLNSKELKNLTLVAHEQFGNSLTVTYKR